MTASCGGRSACAGPTRAPAGVYPSSSTTSRTPPTSSPTCGSPSAAACSLSSTWAAGRWPSSPPSGGSATPGTTSSARRCAPTPSSGTATCCRASAISSCASSRPGRSRLRADLEADGVGPATIRKALGLLQAICRQAVEWEELRANPVKQIRKPPAPRQLAIRPLGPEAVEALRRAMRTDRDATLISVLAYAGLRPEEALALQVRHVGQATLLVEQKNVGGEIVPGQKTARPPRSVELLDPLRRDLAAHLLARGRPGDQTLLFARPDGAPWRETDYRNWRRRIFQAGARGRRARHPPPIRPPPRLRLATAARGPLARLRRRAARPHRRHAVGRLRARHRRAAPPAAAARRRGDPARPRHGRRAARLRSWTRRWATNGKCSAGR